MLTVLGGLAEFERELIRARTGEGRKFAKARGGEDGPQAEADRPPALRRVGKGLPRSHHDARRRRWPRPSRHNLRDERRKLSTQNRNPAPHRPRTTSSACNTHRKQRIVAPRQLDHRKALASVEEIRITFQNRDHFLILIVTPLTQIVALHVIQFQ